jgi:hypothetical protein
LLSECIQHGIRQREIGNGTGAARAGWFQLLSRSNIMGVFGGVAITFVGIVTLFRVLKEQ